MKYTVGKPRKLLNSREIQKFLGRLYGELSMGVLNVSSMLEISELLKQKRLAVIANLFGVYRELT